MLIEFRVANFRSIRDPQALSLVASSGDELPQNICACDSDPDMQLVRSAVIYGANASGKSNLIRALWFMQQFILHSAKESQQGEEILVDSFLFDEKFSGAPSQFEITFTKDNIRYQYGFMADKTRIYEEWLNAYPFNRVQKWFSRKYNLLTNKYIWKFSKFFTGSKQLWTESTRNNALFLSAAVQLNNEQLSPIYNWFQQDLVIIPAFDNISNDKSIEQLETMEGKAEIIKYVNIGDSSISDILFKDLSKDFFSKEFSSNHVDSLDKNKNFSSNYLHFLDKKALIYPGVQSFTYFGVVFFVHPGGNILQFQDQSHGTKNIFAFSGYWIDTLKNGKVIVVDELGNGLHSLAVRFLIELISNSETNKNKAQLVFSTHDTSQLDNALFRRDQVWFIEKDKSHSTQLYPLLDFSPRKDEHIGRGYLRGRYGAIPYIGEWGF